MAAYRASRHDATGYSPNMLMLGRESRMPVDIIYETPVELAAPSYDGYAGELQQRLVTAYEVRRELRRTAERNKRYYDVAVKPHQYVAGDWVYYYNPRKRPGRQDKWERKFSGPYLVIATPSPVNVTIQRSVKAKPFTVHIDKVKIYTQDPPKSWLKMTDTVEKCEVAVQVDDRSAALTVEVSPDQTTELKTPDTPVRTNKESRPEEQHGSQSTEGEQKPGYVVDEPAKPPRPKRTRKAPARYRDYVPVGRSTDQQ